MSLRQIVAVLLALVLIAFVAMNFEGVRVSFLGMRLEMPLAFVILGSAVLGGAVALAWTLVRDRRGSRKS